MHVPELFRKLLVGLLVVAVSVPPGCAGRQPQLLTGSLHDLAITGLPVVTVRYAPSSNLEAFAKGRLGGALKGTGEGFVKGMFAPLSGGGSCGGDFCGAVILLMMAVGATIGAVAGGIHGTLEAVPAATADEVEATLQQSLRDLQASVHLARILASRAIAEGGPSLLLMAEVAGPGKPDESSDYSKLSEKMFAAVLEVAVRQVNYHVNRPSINDLELALEVRATFTLVGLQEGASRIEQEFVYRGPAQPFSSWDDDAQQFFVRQFEAALDNLGEQMISALQAELTVCATNHANVSRKTVGERGRCCWTSPLSPPPLGEYSFWRGQHAEVRARSLQPTLSWESFPHWRDGQAPAGWDGKTDYELKLWEVDSSGAYHLFYRKTGLVENSHRLEVPLKSGSVYAWSVRAIYRVDGVPHMTGWAAHYSPTCSDCRQQRLPLGAFHFRSP